MLPPLVGSDFILRHDGLPMKGTKNSMTLMSSCSFNNQFIKQRKQNHLQNVYFRAGLKIMFPSTHILFLGNA